MRDSAARPALDAGGCFSSLVGTSGPRGGYYRITWLTARGKSSTVAFFAGLALLPGPPVGERERGGFGVGAALAGCGLGVDGFQVVFDDVGVNLRRFDAAVAEHFLNVADAGAAAKHPGGAGMTQAVRGRGGGQVGLLGVGPHEAQQSRGGERVAVLGQKEPCRGIAWLGLRHELRSCFAEVAGEPVERDVADGDEPVFAAFALLHGDGALVALKVVEGQFAGFTGAQAAGVEQLEQRSIPDAFGAAGERGIDQCVELRGAEDVTRQRFAFVQWRQLRGGIGEDEPALIQPREEPFHAPHFAAAGVGGDAIAHQCFVPGGEFVEGDVAPVVIVAPGHERPHHAQRVRHGLRREVPRGEMAGVVLKRAGDRRHQTGRHKT